MKKNHYIIKILAAIAIYMMCVSSLYSQKIISSVNATKSAANISEKLTNKKIESISVQLKSENWLTNKNYLKTNSAIEELKMMMLINETVYEPEREMEEWMVNDSKWNVPINNTIEENRDIEDWMNIELFWKLETFTEHAEIEKWMIDNKFWVLIE